MLLPMKVGDGIYVQVKLCNYRLVIHYVLIGIRLLWASMTSIKTHTFIKQINTFFLKQLILLYNL